MVVLERKFLRRVFIQTEKQRLSRKHKMKTNNGIQELFGEGHMMQTVKGKRISRSGHAWKSSGITNHRMQAEEKC